MSNKYYLHRLTVDLEKWIAKGWVPAENASVILADAAKTPSSNKVAAIVGILGAILLAAGVALFVSANWQEMSKLTRVALLLTVLSSTLGAAIWLQRTSHDYLLEAVLLLAAGIFGANIMLIAQIYHIDNHYPDGLILWTAGALLITLLLRSRAALVLAFGLIGWWAGSEILDFGNNPFWAFLPVWAVAGFAAYWLSFRFGLHLAFLTLMAWTAASLEQLVKLLNLENAEIAGLLTVFMATLFIYGLIIKRKNSPLSLGFGGALSTYGMIGFLTLALVSQGLDGKSQPWPTSFPLSFLIAFFCIVIFGAVQTFRQKILSTTDIALFLLFTFWFTLVWFIPALHHLWMLAAVILGLSIWLLTLGQSHDNKVLVPIALLVFGGEVIYLYAETLGTLLDTSVFFLLGGVLLIGLAFGLEMLRRYIEKPVRSSKVVS